MDPLHPDPLDRGRPAPPPLPVPVPVPVPVLPHQPGPPHPTHIRSPVRQRAKLPWKIRLQWKKRSTIRYRIFRGSQNFHDLSGARRTTVRWRTTTHIGITAGPGQHAGAGAERDIEAAGARSTYQTLSSGCKVPSPPPSRHRPRATVGGSSAWRRPGNPEPKLGGFRIPRLGVAAWPAYLAPTYAGPAVILAGGQ